MLKLRESDVSKQVKTFLEYHGWRAIRMQVASVARPTGGGFHVGEVGMPDYLFLRYEDSIPPLEQPDYDWHPRALPGCCQHLWVETKAPGKKRSAAQEAWAQNEQIRGAVGVVADDYDKFQAWYWQEFGAVAGSTPAGGSG